MDPNAALKEMLELSNSILDNDDKEDNQIVAAAVNLADYVLALDEWIKKGGFLPQRWSK